MLYKKEIELSALLLRAQSDKRLPATYMSRLMPRLINDIKKLEATNDREIKQLFTYHEYDADRYLQYANSPISKLWFMEEGIAYAVIDDPKFKHNNIKEFYVAGDFAGNFNNYLEHLNSCYAIRTLGPVKCWSINCRELCRFMENNALANHIVQHLNRTYIAWQNDTITLIKTLSPAERFEFLLSNFPQIYQLVSKEDIARFVGCSRRSIYHRMTRSKDKALSYQL